MYDKTLLCYIKQDCIIKIYHHVYCKPYLMHRKLALFRNKFIKRDQNSSDCFKPVANAVNFLFNILKNYSVAHE